MKIITLGNELLRRKAERVTNIDKELTKVAGELIDALHKGKGVGLAGPQVSLMKRIFAVHIDKDIPRVFINPSILETSLETVKYEEGCLSIPGVYADVIRSSAIRIQAWNENGRPFTLDAEGVLARVILHEYDHLEGILFIDRLSEFKRKRIITKFEKTRKV
ncbi:MAG: peptide deformylase [Treponema sp.]|nr:peptide deformylase [Treponema sp.]